MKNLLKRENNFIPMIGWIFLLILIGGCGIHSSNHRFDPTIFNKSIKEDHNICDKSVLIEENLNKEIGRKKEEPVQRGWFW